MWVHPGRLPHVLMPRSYHDPERYARELAVLFADGWHCVATLDALRAPGQFVTVEVLGEPVLVRNCDGELRAFQNVCAHRHSMLTSAPRGTSARIRCQYHGWEYDRDGKTCRVPDAASFVPIRRGSERLRRFRAASCGQLVFVSLAETGPTLRDAVDPHTWEVVEHAFGADYERAASWTLDHAANWKIPVENALEGYHIPEVHPNTLEALATARDSTHTIAARFTELENVTPPAGWTLRMISELWRRAPEGVYRHHHAFPSLTIARTDFTSLAQIMLPVSPTRSRSHVFCFVHRGDGRRLVHRVLGPIVAHMVERFTRQIGREDNVMFGRIQRGIESSTHAGVIGAREERIHAFQNYVANALRAGSV